MEFGHKVSPTISEDIIQTISWLIPAEPSYPSGYDATPIIMDERQVMALIQESGNAKIIAVHMDAVDHCLTTRAVLRKEAKKMKIGNDKLLIPEDGEIISLSK